MRNNRRTDGCIHAAKLMRAFPKTFVAISQKRRLIEGRPKTRETEDEEETSMESVGNRDSRKQIFFVTGSCNCLRFCFVFREQVALLWLAVTSVSDGVPECARCALSCRSDNRLY